MILLQEQRTKSTIERVIQAQVHNTREIYALLMEDLE